MKNLEKHILNAIENADNYMNIFDVKWRKCKIHNGFTLLVEPEQISLIDGDIIVAVFSRGYIQFSQIVPLVADIVAEWGFKDEEFEIQ